MSCRWKATVTATVAGQTFSGTSERSGPKEARYAALAELYWVAEEELSGTPGFSGMTFKIVPVPETDDPSPIVMAEEAMEIIHRLADQGEIEVDAAAAELVAGIEKVLERKNGTLSDYFSALRQVRVDLDPF